MEAQSAALGRHSRTALRFQSPGLQTHHRAPWPHAGETVISNPKSKLMIWKSTSVSNCISDTFSFTVSFSPLGESYHLSYPQSSACSCPRQYFQPPNVASDLQRHSLDASSMSTLPISYSQTELSIIHSWNIKSRENALITTTRDNMMNLTYLMSAKEAR